MTHDFLSHKSNVISLQLLRQEQICFRLDLTNISRVMWNCRWSFWKLHPKHRRHLGSPTAIFFINYFDYFCINEMLFLALLLATLRHTWHNKYPNQIARETMHFRLSRNHSRHMHIYNHTHTRTHSHSFAFTQCHSIHMALALLPLHLFSRAPTAINIHTPQLQQSCRVETGEGEWGKREEWSQLRVEVECPALATPNVCKRIGNPLKLLAALCCHSINYRSLF